MKASSRSKSDLLLALHAQGCSLCLAASVSSAAAHLHAALTTGTSAVLLPMHLHAALVPPLALEAGDVQLEAAGLHVGQAGGRQAAGASQAAVLRHVGQLAGHARVQARVGAAAWRMQQVEQSRVGRPSC